MYVSTCTWLLPRNFSYKSPTNHLAFCDLLVFSSRHNRSRQCHLLNTAEFLYFLFLLLLHLLLRDWSQLVFMLTLTTTVSLVEHGHIPLVTIGVLGEFSVLIQSRWRLSIVITIHGSTPCFSMEQLLNFIESPVLMFVVATQRSSSQNVTYSYSVYVWSCLTKPTTTWITTKGKDTVYEDYRVSQCMRIMAFHVVRGHGISCCTRIMVFHGVWRGLWCFTVYEDDHISQCMRIMAFHVVWGSWYFTVCDESYGVSQCMKIIVFHSVWGLWHFILYEDHGILQCVTRVMVFHSVWRLLYFTVYEDYGISCCMMIIVFHSEWRLSYFTVYVEGYGFHSVWGSSYFTVYDQGCGISQWMKIIVFYSVCGGLWFSQCMRIVVFHSVWPGLWYFTVYEDYRILQRMRRIMVFHSVWGLWYVTVYEDYSISNCEGYGISQCTRIMVFHVVWGSLYFTVYEEGYGISQSMRIMAFHSVWRLQSLQYCADTKVQLETVTVFHFETPQQRHNQIVLIAINWKCQRNLRNIIAFPAAWLSTTAW